MNSKLWFVLAVNGVNAAAPLTPQQPILTAQHIVTTIIPLGPHATHTVCPTCGSEINTKTRSSPGLIAYVSGFLIAVFGCWLGCCLVSFKCKFIVIWCKNNQVFCLFFIDSVLHWWMHGYSPLLPSLWSISRSPSSLENVQNQWNHQRNKTNLNCYFSKYENFEIFWYFSCNVRKTWKLFGTNL